MLDPDDEIYIPLLIDAIIIGAAYPWPLYEIAHPVECPEGFDPREN